MKNFRLYLGGMAIFAMLFTSCSKDDESSLIDNEGETATLSFGAALNDLITNRSQQKQESIGDFPECADDAPAYVHVVLEGDENVGTMEDPLMIPVNDTPFDEDGDGVAEYFTEESSDLELSPGNYSLEYFAVYNDSDELIWLAPTNDGDFGEWVDTPLPIDISLGAGVKKYVDVEVLCFDNRFVNEYGYLFFDLNPQEAIEFCIFGNYCPPSGRHYPAEFSVDVWLWEDGEATTQIHENLTNSVTLNDDGDYAGDPLCLFLPDTSDDDEYYFEITLLSSDAYGDVEEEIIRQGVITDMEVREFFDGDDNLEYWHFREGCETDDDPPIFQEPGDDATHYKACLYPENGSEVFGFAYFRLLDNELRATVLATNLENGPHAQHIHVNEDCDDAGGVLFGLPEEGGDWPVATGTFGNLDYNRIFTLTGEQVTDLSNLEDRTINIHGMTVDDEYNAGIVVSCGAIDLHDFD